MTVWGYLLQRILKLLLRLSKGFNDKRREEAKEVRFHNPGELKEAGGMITKSRTKNILDLNLPCIKIKIIIIIIIMGIPGSINQHVQKHGNVKGEMFMK